LSHKISQEAVFNLARGFDLTQLTSVLALTLTLKSLNRDLARFATCGFGYISESTIYFQAKQRGLKQFPQWVEQNTQNHGGSNPG
jgi:hypothetical protein